MEVSKKKKGPKKPYCFLTALLALFISVRAEAQSQTVQDDLIGKGMKSEVAEYLASIIPGGDINLTLTTAGVGVKYPAAYIATPAADATPVSGSALSSVVNRVATAAPTSSWVHLPAATISIGREYMLINSAANPVVIQAGAGNTIHNAGTTFTCAAATTCRCIAASSALWGCK